MATSTSEIRLPKGFVLESSNESGSTLPEGFIPESDQISSKISKSTKKTDGLFGTSIGENSKILQKARMPEIVLKGISKAMMDANDPQFKSVALNAALRVPQTLASTGTDLFSGQVTPEAALVPAILKGMQFAAPAIKGAGRFVGKNLERLSGLAYDTPGVLAETIVKPSLPFKKGTEAAGKVYEAAKDATKIGDEFKGVLDKKDFVKTAFEKAKLGTLTPEEALEARKELNNLKRTLSGESFRSLRKQFDEIAKIKFKDADKAFSNAIKAENLRELLPLNKTGTPSIMKILLGLGGVGYGAVNPLTALAAPLLSPALQGYGASAVGVTRQAASPFIRNPEFGAAIVQAPSRAKEALKAMFGKQ